MKKNYNYRSRVLPVAEALKQPCRDLIVEDGKEFELSEGNEACTDFTHRIAISSIKDLQLLHILPEKINEEMVQKAISLDNEESMELAKRNYQISMHDCDCNDRGKRSFSLRQLYNRVRNEYNLNLARTLSDAHQYMIEIDSPYVYQARKLYDRVKDHGTIEISLFLLNDIIVKSNSTFMVESGAKILSARDIQIYRFGRIVINSSYIKINCNSLQGNFNPFSQTGVGIIMNTTK